MVGSVKPLTLTISGIAVLTVLMVTANTGAMAIRERVREIAVLKTLGFQRWMITALLLTESAVIALAGGVLGPVAARPVLERIDAVWLSQGFVRKMLLAPGTMGWALVVAVALGLTSVAIPACLATRISAVETLHQVV
jgi:putative ABC transport system permease protein